ARRWLKKEPPRSILTWEDIVSKFINEFFPPSKTTNLRNEISNYKQRFDESFHEAWDRYKDLLCACPHHGFTELHQLDTFYNAINPADQDSSNSAAGGNLLKRCSQDVLTIIENKSKQTNALTTAMTAILKQFQATLPPTFVKSVEEICVTCGGAHPYYQCLATGSRSIPSNTIANLKGELKAITTRSGIVLDGPFVPIPLLFINPKEDERVEETLMNQDLIDLLIIELIEPANVAEALRDADWVSAMQEELDQFARLKVWRLVPRPEGKYVIKTKWIFKNKKDESSLVI
nr:reverse transcriptase domain-containing protein [Tanacetum cinerariifolium]